MHRSPEFSSSSQALSQSSTSMGIPIPAPLAPSSNNSTRSSATSPSSSTLFSVVHILNEYASLLTKDYFSSPFLHHSLYSQYSSANPDLTILPLTSMAICCASSIKLSAEKGFFRRAMDAARERLIGNFVSASKTWLDADDVLIEHLALLPMYATVGRTAFHANFCVLGYERNYWR